MLTVSQICMIYILVIPILWYSDYIMGMTEDILAARYFKNGETKREEVYKRVADFIGDTQDERTAYFEMMANDEFLPNSPTLMNAGANSEPFMSACVVLPVEDNMEGIFNSVKNAAICHQRGAGCIAEGSIVFTKRGPEKIEKVRRGDEVWSINSKTGKQSYCTVTETHVYKTDDKKILMVMFEGKGNYTITSDYHPFTVLKDGKYEFVQAKDLNEGDEIVYGCTSLPSAIKFGKGAFTEGQKYTVSEDIIPAPKSYTDSYILSYLAGLFKNDVVGYNTFIDDFNGSFEEYTTKLNAKTGDPVMVLVYSTKHASNIEIIGSLLSKMGIKFGWSFAHGVYEMTVLIQYNTVSHKLLSLMYDGIVYKPENETSVNTLKVLTVTDGTCTRLRDLTVEGNNTYFAGTSGALVFIHNTGFSFNNLRPSGALVHSSQGKASGPISFMQVFDKATSVVSQGGSRRGANMGILRVDHPDVLKFIKCKEIEGDIQNFNISVMITDEFMEYVKSGKMDYVMSTDMDGHENTVGEIWNSLIEHAWRNGEPGVLFYDTINRDNTVPHLGKLNASNPCSELPLLSYESCTLGSINLSKFVHDTVYTKDCELHEILKLNGFTITVRRAVRFLDNVVSKNVFPIQELKDGAEKSRKIGLGLMGVHDAMIKLGIQYDSQESVDFIDKVMELLHTTVLDESAKLAVERGAYPAYKEVLIEEYPYSNTPRKFAKLWNKYMTEGKLVRNANLTTEAPTGTISLLANCSSGIEPVFSYVYKRKNVVGKEYMVIHPIFESRMHELFDNDTCNRIFEHMYETGTIQDMKEIPEYIRKIFKTALDISPFWHIKIQATFQSWVMSSISKTINMPENTTVEEIGDAILLAYSLGCKGLTIYRTNSRQNVVLSLKSKEHATDNNATKSEESVNTIKPTVSFSRGGTLSGRTYTIQSGCCKLYVTINHDESGTIREVFVQNSGAGGCTALLGALGRMISLNLQEVNDEIEFNHIVRSLGKITCPACIKNTDSQAKSCSDSVAKCMKKESEYLKALARKSFVQELILPEINLKEISDQLADIKDVTKEQKRITKQQDDVWICPECGAENYGVQGCKTCKECGFSKCG